MRVILAASISMASLLLATGSSTAAPAGSSSILISEFRTRGPNGANDEFIELFNRSNAPVDIGGWKIMRSSGAGQASQVVQLTANTIIPAGDFYLLANVGAQGFSGTVTPDLKYTLGIEDAGGIAVVDGSDSIVDEVGMGALSVYGEGNKLDPLTANINQSYERNNGGCVPSLDNQNNATDFRYNGSSSYPQNAATKCQGGCSEVVCSSPPAAQCWTALGICTNGTCDYQRIPATTACTDDSVCTQGDACDGSGNCVSGTPVVCDTPPPPFCSDAVTLVQFEPTGTCDPGQGCTYVKQAPQACTWGCNGTTLACNPNPCDAVSCANPPNNCYESTGTCAAGVCSYEFKAAYAACEDGNLCTTGDTCDGSGSCVSGTAKVIDDTNPCTADACNTSTGVVTHDNLGDGSSCEDGNLCNGAETCTSGVCTQGQAKSCSTPPAGGCYEGLGSCTPSTGLCTYQPLPQGTNCSDADLCTLADQCDGNGTCAGSTKSCASFTTCIDTSTSQLNWSGSCNATTGNCVYSQTDKTCGTGCNSSSGLCNFDPCEGVSCNEPLTNCHEPQGTCSNGACSYSLKAAGSSCDDGKACTSIDRCSAAGACDGTPIACNTPLVATACVSSTTERRYDANGSCLPSSGLCDYTYTDITCEFGCSETTKMCAGDPCAQVNCDQPPDQCHQSTGTCTNGTCSYALKTAKSPCDDSNLCTENDVCSDAGSCAGTPIVCNNPVSATCNGSTSRAYNASGTCNVLGVCGYTYVDTACTAGCNANTGICNEDLCAGVTCNQPPGPCSADQGTCSQGTCTYTPKPALVTCNDGDACTGGDVCNGNGQCSGTPIPSCGAGGTGGTGGSPGTGGTVAATGGTVAAAGGTLATSGGTPSTGGSQVIESTGGLAATGGTESIAGGASTAGQSATGGTNAVAGGSSMAGASATAGTSALASTGGSTNTAKTSTGGATATAGSSSVAGTATAAGTTGTSAGDPVAESVEEGGCNCSVPKRSNGAAWAMAFAALLLWRRKRRP